MTDLPRFDSSRRCPKCGYLKATVKFLPSDGETVPDRLLRQCDRCEYAWLEAPLDASVDRLALQTVQGYTEGVTK